MNMQQRVNSYSSDTLIVRFRRRPLGQQIALAAGGLLIVLLIVWLLFGRAGAPPPPPPGPQPVGVIVVQEQPVALTAELPGRTAPYETSEVRPQVDGRHGRVECRPDRFDRARCQGCQSGTRASLLSNARRQRRRRNRRSH